MGDLAAITAYFNPCHYRSRRENYTHFAKSLADAGVPLLTVELAFGEDPFELQAAPGIVQLRARDTMWQKEALLNVAVSRLPAEYKKVAWLDADLLLHSPGWGEAVSRALDTFPIVQCFHEAIRLPAGVHSRGELGDQYFGAIFVRQQTGRTGAGLPGLGWAARREILSKAKLFDAAILGGADLLMCLALQDQSNLLSWTREALIHEKIRQMGRSFGEHYYGWARSFNAACSGAVGYVPERVYTLYHGAMRNRFYLERGRILKEFDPRADITLDPNGCLRWSSPKPQLHAQVRDYFLMRREDD